MALFISFIFKKEKKKLYWKSSVLVHIFREHAIIREIFSYSLCGIRIGKKNYRKPGIWNVCVEHKVEGSEKKNTEYVNVKIMLIKFWLKSIWKRKNRFQLNYNLPFYFHTFLYIGLCTRGSLLTPIFFCLSHFSLYTVLLSFILPFWCRSFFEKSFTKSFKRVMRKYGPVLSMACVLNRIS